MLSSINIHSSVPVYEQIENHVRFAISSGVLKATDRLPSVKDLAQTLEINPNTVAKAYRDLEVMGLIYTRRGMGCYINKGIDRKCRESCRAHIISRLHEVVQEAKAAGISKKDIVEVINKSYSVDSTPYGEVPASVMALTKKK